MDVKIWYRDWDRDRRRRREVGWSGPVVNMRQTDARRGGGGGVACIEDCDSDEEEAACCIEQ